MVDNARFEVFGSNDEVALKIVKDGVVNTFYIDTEIAKQVGARMVIKAFDIEYKEKFNKWIEDLSQSLQIGNDHGPVA